MKEEKRGDERGEKRHVKMKEKVKDKRREDREMIHMGSDHRCVVATFVISTHKKEWPSQISVHRPQTIKKEGNKKVSTLKEIYKEL